MGSQKFKLELNFERIVDGITYRLARTEQDAEEVANFYYTQFLKDEPMTVAMGGYPSFPQIIRDEVIEAVFEGVTLMAIEEKTGKLLGIRLSGIKNRDECEPKTPVLADYMNQYPKIHAYTFFLFDSAQTPADTFAKNPDVHRMYYMIALSTHDSARGRGIASKLVKFSFEVAKMAKCDSAFVYASHDHSQRIFDKIGMTRSAEASLKNAIIDGHKPFEKCSTEKMAVYFTKLQ